MLDQQGAAALDSTEAGIHAVAESWKLAMADREAWFGDRSPVSVEDLLDREYVDRARRSGRVFGEPRAAPGLPRGRRPRLAEHVRRLLAGEETGRTTDVTTGEPTVQRDGATQGRTGHVDVVDRWGT